MLEKLQEILIRECKLDIKKPIMVGLSGGPDSLVLTDILHKSGFPVIIGHLNHMLRTESRDEALLVEKIARQMGAPSKQSSVDVTEYSNEHRLSIEEAARLLRYDFLFKAASAENAQAVAVGHTADDQVETVLMHLLRGSGLAGLKGMSFFTLPNAWSDQIPLVRPLLGVWREEILRYCHEHKLNPVYDKSNLDQTYFRNRLRNDLVPYLENYNPRIKDIILRTANILREDYEIVTANVDEAWESCIVQNGHGYLGLDIDLLRDQPPGILRHIIRRAIAYHRPDLRDIDFFTVERTISFLSKPSRSLQRDLISGLKLSIEDDILWISERGTSLPACNWPAVFADRELVFDIPGKLSLGRGWEITSGIHSATRSLREQILDNTDRFQAWLDYNSLSTPLNIRSRHPGDRFQPHGMVEHSIKISDFMTNEKMLKRARQTWPLVCSKDTIVWIPGYRINHANRITEKTEKILHLRLAKLVDKKEPYE